MTDPIIDKLRKLIAHEKSARTIGNLKEAEAFAARIQDILTAHKLGMDEVAYAEREASEPIDWLRCNSEEVEGNGKRVKVYWQVELAKAIAYVNSSQMVHSGGSSGSAFFFVGRTSDRELCKALWIYLVELGNELCETAASEDRGEQYFYFRDTKNHAKALPWYPVAFRAWMKDYRKAWRVGFADAICKRLYDNYAKAMKKAEGGTAIIHIKKDALAVEAFLKKKTTRAAQPQRSGDNKDAYKRGASTGNAIALTPNRFKPTNSGRTIGLLGA